MAFNTAIVNTKNELITIDSIRQHIINGTVYSMSDASLNLAADASLNYAVVTDGTHTVKLKVYVDNDTSANYRLIEDASWNVNGTAQTLYNFNRNSSETPGVKVYKLPTLTGPQWATGTVILSKHSFANNGTGVQGKSNIGTGSDEYSMILNKSKLYLVNIVNMGAAVGSIAVRLRVTEGSV